MIPKKIYEFLGYNNLAFMIDQEQKHWLLKTDKKKTLIDPKIGDSYQGRVDNLGSDIIVETQKLSTTFNTLANVQYSDNFAEIFQTEPSAFTYNSMLNGLVFARILSTNFAGSDGGFHHYRIKFVDCEEVYIPFGGSNSSNEVFIDKWIVTSSLPIIELMDSSGHYNIPVQLEFKTVETFDVLTSIPNDWSTNWYNYYRKRNNGYEKLDGFTSAPKFVKNTYYEEIDVTPSDLKFYYPLNEHIQPLDITRLSLDDDVWYTQGITSDQLIGLPAFWFTCDITNVGPSISVSNNLSVHNEELITVGNEGNASKYNAHMYIGYAGNNDATPSGNPTDESYLYVSPSGTNVFVGDFTDFNVPINPNDIKMDTQTFNIDYRGSDTVFTMSNNSEWEFVNSLSYKIKVSTFDQNCLNVSRKPLIPVIDIHFDESISFNNQTDDIGYVGIRAGSGNTNSDIYEKYPYDLNLFDGLPEHLSNPEIEVPSEHMAVYAIHNSPTYIPGDPTTRQTAALLLDPGRKQNTENVIDYDFYWPFSQDDQHSITHSQPSGGNNYFFVIQDPSSDIHQKAGEGGTPDQIVSMVGYAKDDNDEYHKIMEFWANPKYGDFNKNDGVICFVCPDPSKFTWDPRCVKNTKEDGTGFEYIDMVYTTEVTNEGAAFEYDLGIRFRVYKNLDLDEANYTRGRVYVLSNDPAEYDNNRTTLTPKPARTAARICDIPTSIAQLSGVKNLAPQSVVDQQYTRTQASYSSEDKDRLWNQNVGSRWVRPIHLDYNGEHIERSNDYVFDNLNELKLIDLINHNQFRYLENLVPMVNPADVSIANITDGGDDYTTESWGYVYIGGFGFEYHVSSVRNGVVTEVALSAPELDNDRFINLANFNMFGTSSMTTEYGTTPIGGGGQGLKVVLQVDNLEDIVTKPGELFEDLFALVRESDGLWLYQYDINANSTSTPKTGEWVKKVQISQFESESTDMSYLTTSDSFMASILPRYDTEMVCRVDDNNSKTPLNVLKNSSYVQIVDNTHIPVETYNSTLTRIDMTKWYSNGFTRIRVGDTITMDAVVNAMDALGLLKFGCYVAWRVTDDNPEYITAAVFNNSFNNHMSNNVSSVLPSNSLRYQKYIHSNASTIISWDVEDVGPVMWVFNPTYKYHETYIMDPERRQFYINRDKQTWENVDIYTSNKVAEVPKIVEDGKFKFNIITNNMCHYNASHHVRPEIKYDQPEFWTVANIGDTYVDSKAPTGNWECVFPRVSAFTFEKEDSTSRKFVPTEMQFIHNSNISQNAPIYDSNTKQDISKKVIIVEDTANGVSLKAWNDENETWEII